MFGYQHDFRQRSEPVPKTGAPNVAHDVSNNVPGTVTRHMRQDFNILCSMYYAYDSFLIASSVNNIIFTGIKHFVCTLSSHRLVYVLVLHWLVLGSHGSGGR